MELDDFRSRWQDQPVTTDTPSQTEQALRTMLTLKSNSPVSKMQRNARRDLKMLFFVGVLNAANFLNLSKNLMIGMSKEVFFAILGLVLSLSLWYSIRQLLIVKKLSQSAAPTFAYTAELVNQMRTLMRSYAYIGLVFAGLFVLAALIGNGSILLERLRTNHVDWGLTILVAFATVVTVAVMVAIGRMSQQDRYGRYLDQLEAALRELRD